MVFKTWMAWSSSMVSRLWAAAHGSFSKYFWTIGNNVTSFFIRKLYQIGFAQLDFSSLFFIFRSLTGMEGLLLLSGLVCAQLKKFDTARLAVVIKLLFDEFSVIIIN